MGMHIAARNRAKLLSAVCLSIIAWIHEVHAQKEWYVGLGTAYTAPVFNQQYPQREQVNLDNGNYTASYQAIRSNRGAGTNICIHTGIKIHQQLYAEFGAGMNFAGTQRFFSSLEEVAGNGQITNNEYRRIEEQHHQFRFVYLAPVVNVALNDKWNVSMSTGLLLAQIDMGGSIRMSVQERNSGAVKNATAQVSYQGSALPGIMAKTGLQYRIGKQFQLSGMCWFHMLNYRVQKVHITNRFVSGIPEPDLLFDFTGTTRHYSANTSGYSPAIPPNYLFSGVGVQLAIQYLFGL